MGGIGKTTISNQIYHKFAVQFGSSSVILNTEEEIGRHGMQHIRCKYISDILEEDIKPSGLSFAYERLKRAKVLLILDDVNNSGQLKDLIGGHSRFGPGSRIILTSRDLQVLKNAGADEIYEVKELNPEDSLKLFCLRAFKQIRPKETYRGLSEKILNYVNGIPLALEVLGSLLYDRTKEEWESELQKLGKLPNPEILNILKLSYDRLDDEQKDIFLDIACFYRGQWENVVAQTLNIFGFSAKIGINVLKERCLISISKGRVVMHCLIGEMGQEIVRKECVHNPGKRSRLWKVGDIDHVLRRNKGTDKIQCILLDICKIKEVQLHAKTFDKMDNLRMLQFYKSYFVNLNESNVFRSSLESLPDSLKVLHWDDFPRRSLPLNFFPENLVRLVMHQCQLEQWEQDQHLPNLKRLDLSNSWKLTEIPDLCLSPNIEEIILSNCVKVVEVYSTCFLSKLNRLCLDGCVELDTVYMPCNILSTSSGEILLYNCRKLQSFSISKTEVPPPHLGRSRPPPPKATGVYSYVLDNASFKSLPCYDRFEEVKNDLNHEVYYKLLREVVSSTFPTLYELCWLDLSNCESLTALQFDLSSLKFLKRLHLRGCSNLGSFPQIKERMENLVQLILDETAIREMPSSLCHLVGLQELSLHRCTSLEIIPPSIGTLTKLSKLGLAYCVSLQTFPTAIFKLKLTELDLHGCSMLSTFPEILEPTKSIVDINLTNTAIQELPSSFENFVGLQFLRLKLCMDLESLPNNTANLKLLSKIDCSRCAKLTEIPSDIGRLSLLRGLSLQESGIVNLPPSIAHLSSLKSLDLSDCKNLQCIPQLPPFLTELLAYDCPSIKRVMLNYSRIQIPSDSTEGIFKFHLTHCQELDPSAHANIVDYACLKITDNAYRSVFFSFPGSAVPHWFPCRVEGHSVTIDTYSRNLCNDNRIVGFALCFSVGLLNMGILRRGYASFSYKLKFESADGIHDLPSDRCLLPGSFFREGRNSFVDVDHTILWKYILQPAIISLMPSHVRSFTFQINQKRRACTIKECGLCPLYNK